jgi:D-glycero-D-manno-heptose 1,7-bisphosphate phosphatase
MRQATWVLLDRDGTLNDSAPEGEYITAPPQLRLLPRVGAAVARINACGMPVAVVSNQRGVALGLMTESDLAEVNATLRTELVAAGAHVDAILCCIHQEGACLCRKPRPGLLEQAAHRLGLSLQSAVMIGDSETDVEAGRRAGTQTIRLGDSDTKTAADLLVPSLWDGVDAILDGR